MNLRQEGEFTFAPGNDRRGIQLEADPNTPIHRCLLLKRTYNPKLEHHNVHHVTLPMWVSILTMYN